MRKKIFLEGTSVKVLYPNIEFFINKLEQNIPFKYLKICHGMFDGIAGTYSNNLSEFTKLLTNGKYDEIGEAIADSKSPVSYKHELDYWHTNVDNLSNRYATSMKVMFDYKSISDDIFVGLSLGVGLGTHWGVHAHNHHIQIARRAIAGIFDNNTYNHYLYAGVFKHFTIKKESQRLFDILNKYEYDVAFLGPTYFSRYEDVFSIKKFNHIEIPVTGAIGHMDSVIEQITLHKNKSDSQSIVFLQCGHMMASNIIYELRDMDITIIDVGRSFDLELKDEVDKHDTMWRCWTGLDVNGLNNYVDEIRE